MPSSSLTASLRSSLVLSRSQLDEWIELEKEKMDVSAEQYRQSLTATQAQVDTAVTHLLALQLEGTLSMESSNVVTSTKEDMKEEQEMLKEEIANLKMEIIDKKCQIKELGLNVLHARDKLVEARDWHENVLQSRGAAVADLGRSVEKYKQLGLEFDKDENEKMIRFSFTQLDPLDPSKVFSFCLNCDDADDIYEVHDCDLDDDIVAGLLEQLNEKEDMYEFMRGMRRAYLTAIQ